MLLINEIALLNFSGNKTLGVPVVQYRIDTVSIRYLYRMDRVSRARVLLLYLNCYCICYPVRYTYPVYTLSYFPYKK